MTIIQSEESIRPLGKELIPRSATEAYRLTKESTERIWYNMVDDLDTRIYNAARQGLFEITVTIESPKVIKKLFDLFTSNGYKVWFSSILEDDRKMTISWEDAIDE